MLKDYFLLTKPGIIFGNLITLSGGFFLANVNYHIHSWYLFIYAVFGISCVIACGCVLNNIIDQDIDVLMERTKRRPLVNKRISQAKAYAFGFSLGAIGFCCLWFGVNRLATFLAFIGLFVYVILYSLLLKRTSVYSTLVGSISGAIPPLVGYCSVSGVIDTGAIILFLMLSIWQMPHSYAIYIYRLEDYKNASIPVLPIKNGINVTKMHMLFLVIMFGICSIALTLFGYTSKFYAIASTLLVLRWIVLAIKGFGTIDSKLWARKMFLTSVIIITILSIIMCLDSIV